MSFYPWPPIHLWLGFVHDELALIISGQKTESAAKGAGGKFYYSKSSQNEGGLVALINVYECCYLHAII